MGTVVVPFMKLKTTKTTKAGRTGPEGDRLLRRERPRARAHRRDDRAHRHRELPSRRIGIDVDPNMVSTPRTNPYVRTDGWDEKSPASTPRKRLKPPEGAGENMATPMRTTESRAAFPGQQAVPAPGAAEELRQLEVARPAAARRAAPRRAPATRWSVRAGTQRQMDVHHPQAVRHRRPLRRRPRALHHPQNIEFMVADPAKVAPLIEELDAGRLPVGGTGNSVSMIAHTQGWLHCDIPGTDASGAVKALMDELIEEFNASTCPTACTCRPSCCEINCGGQADIAIIIQHKAAQDQPRPRRQRLRAPGGGRALPGRGDPSGAGQRQAVARGGREEVHLLRRLLPAVPADADQRSRAPKFAIWVGGKNSNARGKPTFMKMVAAGILNNPPRWPEVSEIVKKILYTYKEDARRGSACPTGSSASAGRASSRRPACRSPST